MATAIYLFSTGRWIDFDIELFAKSEYTVRSKALECIVDIEVERMKENFEAKRQEMMRQLSKRRRDNVVKRRISNMHKNASEPISVTPTEEKKKIAVYGADSFFMKNFINSLKITNEVIFDTDVDKLTEIVLDTGINNLVVDLDEPTVWRKSIDVFTTVRTINPQAQFYVCTKKPDWVQAETLEKQGCIILKKPVDFDEIYRTLR